MVAGPIGAISSSLLLASTVSQDATGSLSVLPVVDETAQLGADLAARYEQVQNNLPHIGDILVSDWGKLRIAGKAGQREVVVRIKRANRLQEHTDRERPTRRCCRSPMVST